MGLVRTKKYTIYFFILLASFCFFRAASVWADEDSDENDYEEEVYERVADSDDDVSSNRGRSIASTSAIEVKMTKPEENEQRKYVVMGEDEYEQVDGSEILRTDGSQNRLPASSIPVPKSATKMTAPVTKSVAAAATAPSPTAGSVNAPMELPTEIRAPQARVVSAPRSPIAVREQYESLENGSGKVVYGTSDVEPRVSMARTRGLQEIGVIASDGGFFPSRVFVTAGIPVKMYLSTTGKNTQCFMSDEFNVKKGIAPGHVEEVSFVAEQPGDYRFYCPVGAIEGKITVRAPASIESAATR